MPVIALTAPTTGTVWQVLKQAGDHVDADEAVIVIESMKMEIPVVASQPGRIVDVRVEKNSSVNEGDVVATLETMP